RRGAVGRSMDQPRPPELPLRNVRDDPLGPPDGSDRRVPPRSRARHRRRHERLPRRPARAALRALRHRLPRLHRRASVGEGQGDRQVTGCPDAPWRYRSPLAPGSTRMSNVVYVLNGPNLNLLGLREPEIYGSDTIDDIAAMLEDRARELGLEIDMRQSNHEGHLIDWMHEANAEGAKAVLLNAAGYTHTSVALHDAIKSITVPVIEVHISDPHKREPFRHLSYVGMAAADTVQGLGARGYVVALEKAAVLKAQ